MISVDVKLRSCPDNERGGPHPPCSVAASAEITAFANRTLALKIEIDWKREESKGLYNRLRDLSWMAAHYRNSFIRCRWAEAMGWRVDPVMADKHDITKQTRKTEKGELSGDAYSCAESEVQAVWSRDAKKIFAGQPLPEWSPTGKRAAALSVSGKEKRSDSGVLLEWTGNQYLLHLRAQSRNSPGGAWLELPIAKNTKRDEHQAEILQAMVEWRTPIKKATIHVERRGIVVRLSYRIPVPALPPMGERVATLGPVDRDGRLHLRTETQTKDYTSKLAEVVSKKDSWDLIRRRVLCQIGRRRGHARLKRERLARLSWDDWLHTYLHTWTREAADWCASQGIGTIRIESIETGDWPAHRFIDMLHYKAQETGINIMMGADVQEESSGRAAKAAIGKEQRKATRRRRAVRELTHQFRG